MLLRQLPARQATCGGILHRRFCAASVEGSELSERQLERIAALQDGRPAEVCFSTRHGRHLEENVATVEECLLAVKVAQSAMNICCDRDSYGSRLFPPHVPEALPLLERKGFRLYTSLRERVTERVAAKHGPVLHANSLISWITGPEIGAVAPEPLYVPRSFDWQRDALHGTFAPHVDQANQPDYDVSALLYLSTAGQDFTGGSFAFNDSDCDRLVQPRAGLMISFTSGFENLHQVRPVRRGERLAFAVWFRRKG